MSKQMREMKDSGIEWIGEIPKEWNVIKNKYLISVLYSGGTPSATNGNFYCQEVGIPFVSISDMSNCSYVVKTAKHITESGIEDKKLQILPIGTILYSIYATVGAISELKVEATISQAILAIQLNSKIDKSFYKYNLTAMRDYIFSNASGNTQFNLNAEKVRNFYFVLPTFSAQRRIADYLDDKCGKIDRYIEQQKQVIEKLKAYKQSVITEAVTKGLDPTVPMKDSGVEWIGEIPEGWTIVKLGHIFSYLGGFAYNSNLYTDESDYQVVRIGNVKNYRLVLESNPVYISESTAKETSRYKLQSNTILFTMTGTKGKRDYFFTYLLTDNDVANKNLFLNQRVGCLIPTDDICPKYFDYLLKDNRILDSVFLYETGTANQGNLGIDSIKRTILQFPPVSEQRQIADFLDSKCSSIDAAIAEKQNLIEKLTEYKKSLIYEVVTGKKEV